MAAAAITAAATAAMPASDIMREAYFVPEGQGRDIGRADDVKVRVAVDGFGQGIIKGLIVDGEPWEPR